jgi:Lrp/AsnC family transcriptional regulator, leucine-responsive regulatory protein
MMERQKSFPSTSAKQQKRDLDAIDRKILTVLRIDGRISVSDLAEKVGLSTSPCWTRLKRLEESGVIRGYVAVLDERALGLMNTVFVEITIDKRADGGIDRFSEALMRLPEVLEVHLVTGEYDYLVKVAVTDNEDYERFVRERLYHIEGIRNSRTTFSLRTLKRMISPDPLQL